MNRLINIVWLLVVAGSANAQGQPSKPDSDRPQLVEVVGCLSQTGANWVLTNASDPATSTTSFTTPEAKPLGTVQIRLLGIAPFSPDGHKGHKMVARGLLIKSAGDTRSGNDTRLNLTSFQMVSETCAK
jgi:hypothetical protein